MTVSPTLVWFGVGLVLVLLEFAVPGVILVFFGIGAWIVAVATLVGLTGSLESQLLLFAVASCVLLFSLRRWIKGKFYGHVTGVQDPSKNLDEFTGKCVVVLKDVIPGKAPGMVEFKGATWSAVSQEGIRKDEIAVITGVDGITLKIAKRKEE
jgi:membrane protein implicated in regulation of membrane protease activity